MAKPDPGLSSWPLPSPQCTNICTMTCFIFMILKTLHPASVSLGDDCPALRPPDSVVSRWADSLPVSKLTPLDSSPFFCSCLYSLSVHRGSTWAQSPHHSSPAPPLLFLWPPPPNHFPCALPSPANWISNWIPQVCQAHSHPSASAVAVRWHMACPLTSFKLLLK